MKYVYDYIGMWYLGMLIKIIDFKVFDAWRETKNSRLSRCRGRRTLQSGPITHCPEVNYLRFRPLVDPVLPPPLVLSQPASTPPTPAGQNSQPPTQNSHHSSHTLSISPKI
jgi:hypothetical protein